MAPSRSVPPAAPAFGLNRRLRRWLAAELRAMRPVIEASAKACDAEHSRKHFTSYQHACLLLFHGLASHPSLHQSYDHFAACRGLVVASGLGPAGDDSDRLGVSYSQVATSNGTRPAAFLSGLVAHLLARLRSAGRGTLPASDPLLGSLVIQDSTFLRLSLRLAHWLPMLRQPDGSGVRVQVWLHPSLDLPEVVQITSIKVNDCQSWDQTILADPVRLAALAGQTLVVDLGYYSHARFGRLLDAGVHLVTRRHPQATITIEADRPIQPVLPDCDGGRITLVADQRVTLGSANNRAGSVLRGLRLVTADVVPRAKTGHRSPTLRDPHRSLGPDRRRGHPDLPLALADRAVLALVERPPPPATPPRLLRERRRVVGLARHPRPSPDAARHPSPRPCQTLPAPPRSPRCRPPASRPHP
jgi:hypothetical protein